MKSWILTGAIIGILLLHQDSWFWDTARPLTFGFLPVGLAYHALYTIGVALFMVVLIRYAWPAEIEQRAEDDDRRGGGS